MLTKHFQAKPALGSDVTLVIVADYTEPVMNKLFDILWGVIYRFERQFSRFIPESELSVFNRTGGKMTPVSPEFLKLLQASRRMSELTDGLYNPFILPALQRAGYTQSFLPGHESDVQTDYSRRTVFPADALEIGDTWARIPYGSALDMGGCGKGYLADVLREYVPEDVVGYWFSLGGDIVAKGSDEDGKPWRIHVEDATHADDTLQVVFDPTPGVSFAVATSGTTKRMGTQAGRRWHHIIDPRTQAPSTSDLQLVSVYCDEGLVADVLASCAVILGSTEAVPFLKAKGVTSGILQTTDGHCRTFGKHIKTIGAEIHA